MVVLGGVELALKAIWSCQTCSDATDEVLGDLQVLTAHKCIPHVKYSHLILVLIPCKDKKRICIKEMSLVNKRLVLRELVD